MPAANPVVRMPQFLRHFAINVVIGLALMIILGMPFVQKNAAVASLRDGLINWQMDKLKGLGGAKNIVWINIDTESYRSWGEPLITRRDKLAQLLEFAMRHEPRAVIIDIDLSTSSRFDAALVRVLKKYSRCQDCAPPIVLVRSFDGAVDNAYPGQAGPVNVARRSFLDQALGTSPEQPWKTAGQVQWGAVTTDHDPDHMVRRWRLWENSCTAHGEPVLTPSIVVLAVAQQRRSLADIRAALQPHASACERRGDQTVLQPNRSLENELTGIGNPPHSIVLTEHDLQRRIIYHIQWDATNEADPVPALGAVLRADPITKGVVVDGSVLQDRIVVIGSSWDPLDVHRTPIGEMPGTLVLINELNSLEQGDVLAEPSAPARYALEIVLVLFVSLVFALVPPAYALIVVLAAISLGTLTLGLVAFNAGVWVDSVIPLIGVLLHEVVSRSHEKVAHLMER
jgi:CHASE2 domain-containing sensor protein